MDLLRRFALGEIDAFETLVRQFQGDIYAWIVRIVRDPGIAEDLTAETLWRIYRARHQFRPDGNFGAWARRIATNLAFDHLRRKRPEQSLLAEPAGAPQSDQLLQRETREKIQQAFRRLPAKLQVAAMLALVEEQPYDEIADALGTSVGAVKLRDSQSYSDPELFWIIKNGIRLSGMPAFGRVESDEHIWGLVLYVRTLPKKISETPQTHR